MTSKTKTILMFSLVLLIVDTRRTKLKPDEVKIRRDYRPSKWLANSAMDVWYANASFVDVITRELKEVVDIIASRPVRSTNRGSKQKIPNSTIVEEEIDKVQTQNVTNL